MTKKVRVAFAVWGALSAASIVLYAFTGLHFWSEVEATSPRALALMCLHVFGILAGAVALFE